MSFKLDNDKVSCGEILNEPTAKRWAHLLGFSWGAWCCSWCLCLLGFAVIVQFGFLTKLLTAGLTESRKPSTLSRFQLEHKKGAITCQARASQSHGDQLQIISLLSLSSTPSLSSQRRPISAARLAFEIAGERINLNSSRWVFCLILVFVLTKLLDC